MHWHKAKSILKLKGGKGFLTTEKMRGSAEHIIVNPERKDTEYDISIVDKEGDCIYERFNHIGRLDDKEGLPIGKDQQESITVYISNASYNDKITIIFKVRDWS